MESSRGGAHWGIIMKSFVLNMVHLRYILELQKEEPEKVKRGKLDIYIYHSLEHII